MKKLILLLVIGFSISQTSCDLLGLGEDKVCGDSKQGYFYRTSHGTGFFTDDATKDYLLERTYQEGSADFHSKVIFEKWVQHVCPDKHVKFKSSISANIEGDFTVSSKAYWYFFFEEPLTLKQSNDGLSRIWEGNGEIGLKQTYGDAGEGEFTLQATIDFPWQGSFLADSMYFFNKMQNVTLEADYYDVK